MIGEEVVDDGIEVLGREYLGGRIGISMEIVEVSEGVAFDAGSESFDREGSKDNSESVEWEGSTMGVILRREIVERIIRERCSSLIDFRAAAWVFSISVQWPVLARTSSPTAKLNELSK